MLHRRKKALVNQAPERKMRRNTFDAMWFAAALVLAISATTSAKAAEQRYQPNEVIIFPPPEFDRPFDGRLEEFIVKDHEELANFCGQQLAFGCAFPAFDRRSCLIYLLPDDFQRRYGITIEIARRHEIAHCNGWHHPHHPPLPGIDPWSLEVSKPSRAKK